MTACYRFVDRDGFEATVYMHDGHPGHAWYNFAETLKSGLAWTLPRYCAHDFASAFVAVNKKRAGGVYWTAKWNFHADLSYLYKLTINNRVLILKIEQVSAGAVLKPSRWSRDTLYHGPLHRVIFSEGQLIGHKSTGMGIERINKMLQVPGPADLGELIAEIDHLGLADMPGDTFTNLARIVERLRP